MFKIKNNNQKHFVQVNDAILTDNRLSCYDKILLIFYLKVSIDKDYSYYDQTTISKILNITDRKIRDSNKKLEKYKYIKIKKEAGRTNIITINKIKDENLFDTVKKYRSEYHSGGGRNDIPTNNNKYNNNKLYESFFDLEKSKNKLNKAIKKNKINDIQDLIKILKDNE